MGGGGSKIQDPVLRFFDNAGRFIAKTATSAVGNMIPVIGKPLADKLNSLYAKGGKVLPVRFEAGGEVHEGFKAKVINTPAQLIQQINKYPEVAKQSGLTVQMVKDAVQELKNVTADASKAISDAPAPAAPAMKNGGLSMRMRGRGGF